MKAVSVSKKRKYGDCDVEKDRFEEESEEKSSRDFISDSSDEEEFSSEATETLDQHPHAHAHANVHAHAHGHGHSQLSSTSSKGAAAASSHGIRTRSTYLPASTTENNSRGMVTATPTEIGAGLVVDKNNGANAMVINRIRSLEEQISALFSEIGKLKDKLDNDSEAHGSKVLASTTSMPRPILSEETVVLDVGGQIFKTTKSTLCKYHDSMLARMFSGSFSVVKDKNGAVFIDRSPKHFPTILQFLRGGTLQLPENMNEVIELEAEFGYYGLAFPDDAFMKYIECYALEKVLILPKHLPKLKEARSQLIMVCSDPESAHPWLVGLLNIHRGTLIKEPINLEPLMRKMPEKVFSRGFIITDSGPRVWFLEHHECYLLLYNVSTGVSETIELDKSIDWNELSYRAIGTRDILVLYRAASPQMHATQPNTKNSIHCFINLTTKCVHYVEPLEDREFCLQVTQLGDTVVCLFKSESTAKYLRAWNTITWARVYERKAPSNTVFLLALNNFGADSSSLAIVDENGAGYILDQQGCTTGIYHPVDMEPACGRKLKPSDRIASLGRYIIVWPHSTRFLLIYEIGNHKTITKLHGLLPFPNNSRSSVYALGQRLVFVSNAVRQVAVLAPSHHIS